MKVAKESRRLIKQLSGKRLKNPAIRKLLKEQKSKYLSKRESEKWPEEWKWQKIYSRIKPR